MKPRTRALYASLLRVHIQPTLGELQLPTVTPVAIRKWYAGLDTGPTAKANAYGLLRTILAEAVDDGLLAANPARIKGAGSKRRARDLRVLSVSELNAIVDRVPPRYQALIVTRPI